MENQHCLVPFTSSLRMFPHSVSVEREDYKVNPDSSAKNVVILVVTSRPDDIPASISGKKNVYMYIIYITYIIHQNSSNY